MKYEYSGFLKPPALLLPLQISGKGFHKSVQAMAILDTGADKTVITFRIVRELGLSPRGYDFVRVPTRTDSEVVLSFYVSIRIPPDFVIDADVIALPHDLVIIGRDILNQLVLHADGPKKIFELNQ
jgi:hypothetical protein